MTRRGSVDVEGEGGPWRRRPSSSSRLASLVARAQSLYDGFQAQPMATRLALVLFGLLYAATIFVVVFVVGPEQVLHYTASFALVIRGLQHARIALVALIVVSSFPPMVGYGTLVTLAGMAFGSAYVPEGSKEEPSSSSSSSSSSTATDSGVVLVDHGPGSIGQAWLVAATGCLLGAMCSFTFLRHVALNSTWGRKVARIDKLRASAQWRAMETAVTRRGWTMALLLRFSPFPFTISNLFFASLQPISLGHFVVATACTTPKLLLHVFVGARMFELIHRGARASLDDKSRILNGVYIVLGSLVGFFTSYYVYRETRKILSTYEDPRLVSSPDSGPVDDESLDDVHLTHVVYDADEAAARRTQGVPSRRDEARERERQAFLGLDASPRLSGSGSSTPRRGTGYQDKAG